jgi:hypothetical protein
MNVSCRHGACANSPRFVTSLAAVFCIGAAGCCSVVPEAYAQTITEQEARAIGVEAYIYFYPLVTMEVTRKQFTNIEPGKGPMNAFNNIPTYPPADFKGVVRPNFDTLYSVSYLDMTTEPVVCRYRTRTAGITCCPCSTCGRMSSPRRAGAPPAPKQAISW